MKLFSTKLIITTTKSYNFNWALEYLRSSPSTIIEGIDTDNSYHRALELKGHKVLLVIRGDGDTINKSTLTLEIKSSQPISADCEEEGVNWVRKIFSLDSDYNQFMSLGVHDDIFSAVQNKFYGMRPVLIGTPFEAILWAIIGQQVNVTFARKLKMILVDRCGRHLNVGGRIYPMLPHPGDILKLGEEKLRSHQFSRQKARYIISISKAVISGEIDFCGLCALSKEMAIQALTKHIGIGRWSAEYVMMRGIGAYDYIPAADVGLQKIAGELYKLGRNATEIEIRQITDGFKGWRSWVAFYWWMLLQQNTKHEQSGRNRSLANRGDNLNEER